MKHNLRSILLLAGLMLFMGGCGPKFLGEELKEGYIKYNITYPNPGDKEGLIGVLPDQMLLSFKENKVRTDLKAGFGMFSLSTISHEPNTKLTHLCRIITSKYVVDLDQNGAQEMLKLFPKYSVEPLGEVKEIAGYTCKSAKITDTDNPDLSFKVFYTDKIKVNAPNWFTPFHQIDGMLMEYEIDKFNMHMKLVAEEVSSDSIAVETFKRPGGYKPINYPSLEGKLEKIMDDQ
ncbi:MAG: DUF4412 domain-containing protein [Salibacteraceae bacterium]